MGYHLQVRDFGNSPPATYAYDAAQIVSIDPQIRAKNQPRVTYDSSIIVNTKHCPPPANIGLTTQPQWQSPNASYHYDYSNKQSHKYTYRTSEPHTRTADRLKDASGPHCPSKRDGGETEVFYYGPFGELIRATGSKVDDFNFRFSTKYQDAETGLLYYGFRYYDPVTGRWPSRDPIGLLGGLNLYGMVSNNLVGSIDYLGLRTCEQIKQHREIVYNVLNRIAAGFEQGGTCAGSEASSDWLSTAENTNVAIGAGITAKTIGGIIDGATIETYGLQTYAGAASQTLSTVGKVSGGVGIAYDSYQAVDAFSNGDIGGGVSNTASAGLGGIGLAIASSNPATALAAAGGALAIGVAEQAALSYIDRKDRAAVESYCQKQNQIFQDGMNKLDELSEEAEKGCCNK